MPPEVPPTSPPALPAAHPPADRPCVELQVPPGPAGLAVLTPALAAALDGSGPAVALVPASGPAPYRERIRAAVRPGEPVPPEVAVVAATSGSTGNPSGVLLPADALRAASVGFADRTGHPDGHRWVAALPLVHAGGLMVVVRSLVAGTSPVGLDSLGGGGAFTVEGFARATEEAVARSDRDDRPLAVSVVPAMLARLDAAGATGWDLLAIYDAVLVGGAAAPRSLLDRLLFTGVHLFTSYGMTETCGGAVVDGRPLPGMSVTAQADGRLRLCGRQVALGYRDGGRAERWGRTGEGSRCFGTDDLGTVDADGLVSVTGRADDVVQVGGTSVSLQAIAQVMGADPRVGTAEVVALPDERLGASVVALVVPGVPEPDHRELADVVEAQLGRAARPRAVRLVPDIPLLESGKPDRAALVDLARAALA